MSPKGAKSPSVITLVPSLLRHLVTHPGDLGALVSAGWRLRRRGWWRRWPFLPIPGKAYWAFRVATLNGSEQRAPLPEEIVAAARWAKAHRASR